MRIECITFSFDQAFHGVQESQQRMSNVEDSEELSEQMTSGSSSTTGGYVNVEVEIEGAMSSTSTRVAGRVEAPTLVRPSRSPPKAVH